MTEPLSAISNRFGKRQAEIVDAAARLINRQGLRHTTLQLVADEIGVPMKSLRHYYQRKEDLVIAAFLKSLELYQATVQRAADGATVPERLAALIQGFVDNHRQLRTGTIAPFAHFGDLRSLAQPEADTIYPIYGNLFRSIRALLQDDDAPWNRATGNARTHFVFSQMLWAVTWLQDFIVDDLDVAANEFADLLLNGIAPDAELVEDDAIVLPEVEVPQDGLSPDAFLMAATRLINAYGYRGASISRVSAELGVTKGAFYHYHDDKDELVVACFERTFDLVRQAQNAAIATRSTGITRVFAVTRALSHYQMGPNGAMLRVSALPAIDLEHRAQIMREMDRLTARFGDMLADGAAGSLHGCRLRIAAQMVNATINSTEEVHRWTKGITRENVDSRYSRFLFSGILQPD